MGSRFSSDQLMWIREQATIYQCACPAQVSSLLSEILQVYQYQADCLNQTDTDIAVHETIAKATAAAYSIMETCLADVLTQEGWDMQTLTMPNTLTKRMLDAIESDRN